MILPYCKHAVWIIRCGEERGSQRLYRGIFKICLHLRGWRASLWHLELKREPFVESDQGRAHHHVTLERDMQDIY